VLGKLISEFFQSTVSAATWRNMAEPRRNHRVYVIELDGAVLDDSAFRTANPRYAEGQLCVYVGSTGLSPQERFERHKAGVQSNSYVRRFGIKLIPAMYESSPPMMWAEALEAEAKLAEDLRSKGYAVWQN
jgi:hypothetical protein